MMESRAHMITLVAGSHLEVFHDGEAIRAIVVPGLEDACGRLALLVSARWLIRPAELLAVAVMRRRSVAVIEDLRESLLARVRMLGPANECSSTESALAVRVARARRMILEVRRQLEVAHACGFADESHLIRSFRKFFGVTPAEYRRSMCTGTVVKAG